MSKFTTNPDSQLTADISPTPQDLLTKALNSILAENPTNGFKMQMIAREALISLNLPALPLKPVPEAGPDRQRHVAQRLNAIGWRAYHPETGEMANEILIGPPIFMQLRNTENRIVIDERGTAHNLAEYLERQATKAAHAAGAQK